MDELTANLCEKELYNINPLANIYKYLFNILIIYKILH